MLRSDSNNKDSLLFAVAKTVAVSVIGGAAIALLGTAKDQAVRRVTNSFRVSRGESAYAYTAIARWLLADRLVSIDRHFSMANFYDDNTGDITIAVPPAGSYFARYEGVRVWIDFGFDDKDKGSYSRPEPVITIIALGDRKGIVIAKIRSVLAHQLSDTSLRIEEHNGHRFILKRKRPLSSVVLNAQTKAALLDHLDWWKSAEEEYAELGITYKTGILLEGPPGTGKSSLAQAIASHLDFTLVSVDVLSLGTRLTDIKRNSVVLIEDIDRDNLVAGDSEDETDTVEQDVVGRAKQSSKKSGKAKGLGALMNILDGATSPEGIVFVLSANHPERLDPALLRPGRIDIRCHLGYFDEQCAIEMGSLFGVAANTVLELGQDVWQEPAKLQTALMRIKHDRRPKPKSAH